MVNRNKSEFNSKPELESAVKNNFEQQEKQDDKILVLIDLKTW